MTDVPAQADTAPEGNLLETLRAEYDAAPGNTQAASHLAEHYSDLGWLNEALDVYRTALARHPDDFYLQLGYGNTCYRHQDMEDALKAFRRLTELRPDRIEGWNNSGIVLMSLGRAEEAKSAFEWVLAIEPENAGALLNLGNYYAGIGDPAAAAGLFEQAIEVRPDFADAWFNLGNARSALGEDDHAQRAYERAIRVRREFGSAYKNLGVIHERREDWEKAVECYLAAAAFDRADAGLQINLANAYLALERFDDAKSCFLKAVRLSPKNTAGWLGLRHLALLKGDIPTYLRSTCAIIPHLDAGVIAATIDVLLSLHHLPEAIDVLRSAEACSKEGDDLDAQRLLVYHLEQREKGRQTALYKKLSQLSTLSDPSLRALGRYALETGDPAAALRHLKKIAIPDAVTEYLAIACLLASHERDTARERLARAIERWPASGALRFLDARIAMAEGDREGARIRLIEALDNGFCSEEEIKKDPELSYLFATLATRPAGSGGITGKAP